MAAPSREDVAEMIKTALTEFEQRGGSHMQAMQAEHVSVEQARSSLPELAAGTRQEFFEHPGSHRGAHHLEQHHVR